MPLRLLPACLTWLRSRNDESCRRRGLGPRGLLALRRRDGGADALRRGRTIPRRRRGCGHRPVPGRPGNGRVRWRSASRTSYPMTQTEQPATEHVAASVSRASGRLCSGGRSPCGTRLASVEPRADGKAGVAREREWVSQIANLATGLVGGSFCGAALRARLLCRKAGRIRLFPASRSTRVPVAGLERCAPRLGSHRAERRRRSSTAGASRSSPSPARLGTDWAQRRQQCPAQPSEPAD
jgi:hypothetical protein